MSAFGGETDILFSRSNVSFFSEREYGAFQRTFRLPPDADSEKVDAEFSDGILRLKIAKRTSSQIAGRKIEVRKT